MRIVRLYYKKLGRMRFVSHLDMARFMIRAITRAKISVWHTEGFNPRPYVTFALPLSLGFESSYEIAEIRLLDDALEISEIVGRLNAVCPEYIRFFEAREAEQKMKRVTLADYIITFDDGGELRSALADFLKKDNILAEKKTKKGDVKQIDLVPHLVSQSVCQNADGNTELSLRLPAGSNLNVNPELLLNAFFLESPQYACYKILRTAILNEEGELFR